MKQKISNIPYLKSKRQYLRRNLTSQETILWSRLRDGELGYKFRRQHSFGKYIADFYCRDLNLIIEVDGSQHLDQEEYDLARTRFFQNLGLPVLRFWDSEVNANLEGVMTRIQLYIDERKHPLSISPSKEGERESGV